MSSFKYYLATLVLVFAPVLTIDSGHAALFQYSTVAHSAATSQAPTAVTQQRANSIMNNIRARGKLLAYVDPTG